MSSKARARSSGLIAQPLSFYLKQGLGWTPLQVTAWLAIFNFPWIIKPLYGAFSDFVPLFGYRRKSYLLDANVAAIMRICLDHAADGAGPPRFGRFS